MRAPIVVVVVGLALLASSVAAPRKVLVLPLDGNAPAGQRSKLNATVVKMAKKNLQGSVTVGDTTFAETAAAVGCSPDSDACAETVLTTLAVDELVYGTATKDGANTTVVVKRAVKGSAPRSQTATIAASDAADKAEPGLEPLFGEPVAEPLPPVGSADGSAAVGPAEGSAVAETPRPRPARGIAFFDTRERKLGVALAGGGVVALAVGISFWLSKTGLQEEINSHPTRTSADFAALEDLEDRASSKATWGNIMVALGVGLGGAGAYFLWKDHKNREATVTPQPVEAGTGMTLVFGGRW